MRKTIFAVAAMMALAGCTTAEQDAATGGLVGAGIGALATGDAGGAIVGGAGSEISTAQFGTGPLQYSTINALDGGSVGLTAGLSQLTGRAGSEARHAGLSLEAQDAIHAQVIAERESVSGVNLDEEAADLLRYQQAYQAAAQIIKTADDMFQTLLGVVR